MKKYLLPFILTVSLLTITGAVIAQGPGSVETIGGTAGVIVYSTATGNTTASVSETLYMGPGIYEIDGTWEIYSKNVWISPDATITGTGVIKFFNPSVAGGASSPTLIDGNNNAAFINVNLELDNASNMMLTDISGAPVSPWTDVTSNANLTTGKDFNFAIANGDVLLGNFDMITATAATLSGFQPDRFVVTAGTGHLVHQNYTGSFIFPAGIAEGDYTPAAVTNTSANGIHVLVQDYTASAADESTLPVASGILRTWNIYSDNAAGNSDINLEHNTTTNQGSFNSSSHFVTQWSSAAPNSSGDNTSTTAWQSNILAAGATGNLSSTGTVAGSEMRTHNYTNFATSAADSLAFFTKNSNPAILPIKLVSFTGRVVNCNAIMSWVTAEEINGNYFELQRSINGGGFIAVARIVTKGSNSTYNYTDATVPAGNVQYRLRIVDKDGKEEFSKTVSLNINCNRLVVITVNPNPVKDIARVNGLAGKSELRLTDVAGRVLITFTTTNTTQEISMGKFASGTYLLQVIQDDKIVKSMKLIKK